MITDDVTLAKMMSCQFDRLKFVLTWKLIPTTFSLQGKCPGKETLTSYVCAVCSIVCDGQMLAGRTYNYGRTEFLTSDLSLYKECTDTFLGCSAQIGKNTKSKKLFTWCPPKNLRFDLALI